MFCYVHCTAKILNKVSMKMRLDDADAVKDELVRLCLNLKTDEIIGKAASEEFTQVGLLIVLIWLGKNDSDVRIAQESQSRAASQNSVRSSGLSMDVVVLKDYNKQVKEIEEKQQLSSVGRKAKAQQRGAFAKSKEKTVDEDEIDIDKIDQQQLLGVTSEPIPQQRAAAKPKAKAPLVKSLKSDKRRSVALSKDVSPPVAKKDEKKGNDGMNKLRKIFPGVSEPTLRGALTASNDDVEEAVRQLSRGSRQMAIPIPKIQSGILCSS